MSAKKEIDHVMGEGWRARVAEREKDEVINCKRCKHYMADSYGGAPICFAWSKVYGTAHRIGLGYSGERNDAPFCQMFEVKP